MLLKECSGFKPLTSDVTRKEEIALKCWTPILMCVPTVHTHARDAEGFLGMRLHIHTTRDGEGQGMRLHTAVAYLRVRSSSNGTDYTQYILEAVEGLGMRLHTQTYERVMASENRKLHTSAY